MMTKIVNDDSETARRGRKLLLQLVIGMIAGAITSYVFLDLLKETSVGRPTGEQALAVGVGLVYLLTGLFVAIGAANPALGAKMLNVADAEEVTEDRSLLMVSALAACLCGASLLVLSFAAPRGPFPAALALGLLVAAMIATAVLWRRSRQLSDEFRRLVGAQASEAAFGLTFLLFGGWASLAHLGYAPMFGPLGFVAGTMAMVLLGAFVVAGQRGLLTPR